MQPGKSTGLQRLKREVWLRRRLSAAAYRVQCLCELKVKAPGMERDGPVPANEQALLRYGEGVRDPRACSYLR